LKRQFDPILLGLPAGGVRTAQNSRDTDPHGIRGQNRLDAPASGQINIEEKDKAISAN
jgi:hypothetical protein